MPADATGLMRSLDPTRRKTALPLTATYYPGGFRVEIATNSEDTLAAAAEAWEPGEPEFAAEPVRLRVLVEGAGPLCGEPAHRMQEHLYGIVADAANFADLDLERQFGFLCVSRRTAADHSWFRWFFLEAAAYILLTQRQIAAVHAACVARDGAGILLSGPSCAGKTTLSYACARAGWSLVSDDATWLVPGMDRLAVGRPGHARFRPDAPRLFPELERFAARARPNGKIAIEVPLRELPQIRTAARARIGGVAFLERGAASPEAVPLARKEAVQRLLADMPSYNEKTDALHERAVRRLAGVPAWRLRYQTIEDGIGILEDLVL